MVVDNDLRIIIPCVEYTEKRYQVILDRYDNPSDSSWLYWKLTYVDVSIFAGRCGTIDSNNFNITNLCTMIYGGKQYLVTLDYYPNPLDSSRAYWKLGNIQEVPVTIEYVSGPTMDCFSTDYYMDMISCMAGCGEDLSCILNCFGYVGGFSLALRLNNYASSDTEFTICSATTLVPAQDDVQTMMVLQDVTLSVHHGSSIYCIPVYCLNSDLSAPGEEDAYTVGGMMT